MRIRIAMVGAAIGLLLATGAQADSDAQIAHRLKQLDTLLNARCHDCDALDIDDAATDDAIRRTAALLEARTVTYFAGHAVPSSEGLHAAIQSLGTAFDPRYEPFHGDMIALGGDNYLVHLDGAYEDVLVVRSKGGHAAITWRIGDLPVAVLRANPDLGAWSADPGRHAFCPVKRHASCEMISASIGRLPDMADGRHRFYVASQFRQMVGCTLEDQLSIWREGDASPLLAKSFGDYCDGKGEHLTGNVLHVDVKEEYTTFVSFGCCAGRQTDWRIRIDPDGIKDLGESPDVPELDIVDALFRRIIHRQDANSVASSQAIRAMKSVIVPHLTDIEHDGGWYGDLYDYRVTRQGANTDVCMTTDSDVWPAFRFTLVKSESRQIISRVVLLPSDATCGR